MQVIFIGLRKTLYNSTSIYPKIIIVICAHLNKVNVLILVLVLEFHLLLWRLIQLAP